MRNALDIAHWLLAWADHIGAPISNLKMQKLLYYAQGHHLGSEGKPLFSDNLQAWAHGPVAPEVYHAFKTHGNEPINPDEYLGDGFSWDDYRDVEQHLMGVWDKYGHHEAWSLRERTHREAPWKDAFSTGERNVIISQDDLKAFFSTP